MDSLSDALSGSESSWGTPETPLVMYAHTTPHTKGGQLINVLSLNLGWPWAWLGPQTESGRSPF